jgi:cell division protein FtsL
LNVYVREYQKIERRSRRRDNFLVRYLPILLVLAGAAVVGKIYAQSVAMEWSARVVERKGTARDLELQNADLERAIATLASRERVAREAGERLGMVVPTERDLLWLTVLDHGAPPSPETSGSAATRDPRSLLRGWLDALWQEEALALTSQ